MPIELDHIFILTDAGAPVAEHLTALGLAEGPPNIHPGQGTACRRVFFANAYLELLWVADAAGARSPRTAPTHLWERWNARDSGACPFGIVTRPAGAIAESPPFSAWTYRPTYLPTGFEIGENAPILAEPLLAHLPRKGGSGNTPLRLARAQIEGPFPDPVSPTLAAFRAANTPLLRSASKPLLTIELDGGPGNRRDDLRPFLPLVLNW